MSVYEYILTCTGKCVFLGRYLDRVSGLYMCHIALKSTVMIFVVVLGNTYYSLTFLLFVIQIPAVDTGPKVAESLFFLCPFPGIEQTFSKYL